MIVISRTYRGKGGGRSRPSPEDSKFYSALKGWFMQRSDLRIKPIYGGFCIASFSNICKEDFDLVASLAASSKRDPLDRRKRLQLPTIDNAYIVGKLKRMR